MAGNPDSLAWSAGADEPTGTAPGSPSAPSGATAGPPGGGAAPPADRRRRRGWRSRVALALSSLVITTLGLEGAVRVLVAAPAPVRLRDGIYVSQLPIVTGRDTVARIEGEPLDESKRPGERRILVLGESSVQGEPWGYPGSPATMLYDRLRAALPGLDITVINAGRGAAMTRDSYYFLTAFRRFAPDVIVFYQGANDGFSGQPEMCLPARHPFLHAAWRALVERSRLLWTVRVLGPRTWVEPELRSKPTPLDESPARDCDERQGLAAWIRILVDTAAATGAHVVVTTPVENPLRAAETPRSPAARAAHRALLACLLEPGCDPAATFRRNEAVLRERESWVAPRGLAWREAAAGRAAVAVVDFARVLAERAGDGLDAPIFSEDVHLSLDGYWRLAGLWTAAVLRAWGRPEAIGDPFGGLADVDNARYRRDVMARARRTLPCILLRCADVQLLADLPLIATPLLRDAVALDREVGVPGRPSRAGLTAQRLLDKLRRDTGLASQLPAELAGLGEVDLAALTAELRGHSDCREVGGAALAGLTAADPIAADSPPDRLPSAADPSRDLVIPPGQEGLVMQMLAPDPGTGCVLDSAHIEARSLHAIYRCAGDRTSALELTHIGTARAALATTVRFDLTAGTPAPDPALVAAVAASLRRHEAAFRWVDSATSAPRPRPHPG